MNKLKRILKLIEDYYVYFRGESYVYFKEVNGYDDVGEHIRYVDGFTIYVCRFGKCQGHFGTIEWSDVDLIIETLETAKKHVELEIEFGNASTSKVFIPKWAKANLIRELKERKDVSM